MPRLLGAKVRGLRQARGLTQLALAQQLGLAMHSHVAKLESGHDEPSLALVVRIASVFAVPTDYLLRDSLPVVEAPAIDAVVPSPASPELFGARLRALRLREGRSQSELARALGLKRRGYISNLEAGRKKPSLDLVILAADYFQVSIDALLRGDADAQHSTGDPPPS